jgi:hypothetical protein
MAKWRRKRNVFSHTLSWLSWEVLLDCFPNCGAVILARALWTGAVVYVLALVLKLAIDPATPLTLCSLQAEAVETVPWLGATIAASYAALYSRFASQWAYLAELYNQIKAAELSMPDVPTPPQVLVLAEWKAGFLEDCETLHLARKSSFASTIRQWGAEPAVEQAFVKYAQGGERRFRQLLAIAAKSLRD